MLRLCKYLICFIFSPWVLLYPISGQAQHHQHFFYGSVYGLPGRRPLSKANLRIEGTKSGTTTDKNGAFSFFHDSVPSTLLVSHVGFETKTVLLDETSFSLQLYLEPKSLQLAEVEITATRFEPFFRSSQYSVLDYDVDSNQVWLLIFRQRIANAALICLSIYGDTLSKSRPLGFKPVRMFRDCIGTLHLLGRDSGYQVFLHDRNIELIHPVKIKKFDDILKNCVAATRKTLYFRKETENGLSVEFFGINRQTLDKKSIKRVDDKDKIRMKRRNGDDLQLLNSARPPGSRDDFVNWSYVHKILYRPVSAKLYLIGMYTCIFNTPDRQVEFYDSLGNYSYKLRLLTDQADAGRWTREIETDRTTGKAFSFFINGGLVTVYEIDLNTGILKRQIILEHVFPEKIRIFNGWVYYLYDLDSEADNKALYRQKL